MTSRKSLSREQRRAFDWKRAKAPMHVPGAAFFCGSALMFLALLLALRSFRKSPVTAPAANA